jgi:hypothetical protein
VKRFVTFACRGLAIYFGTLALTLFLADTLRGRTARAWDPMGSDPTATASTLPGGGGSEGCPDCTESWMRSSAFLKGIECQHGPYRKNSGCPIVDFNAERDCWELNNGIPSPITGVPCYCFSNCQSVKGYDNRYECEAEFLVWLAWCGEDRVALNKHCALEPGAKQWTYVRRAYTNDGKPCTAPKGHDSIRYCGYDKVLNFG